jgi:hypothetical protein
MSSKWWNGLVRDSFLANVIIFVCGRDFKPHSRQLQGGASQNHQPAVCKGSSGLGRRDQQQQQQLLVVYMKNFEEVFQQSN